MIRQFRLINGEACTVFDMLPNASDLLDSDFTDGWLCFEHGKERRRLAPIPDDWEDLSDRHLSQMWAQAKPVRRMPF